MTSCVEKLNVLLDHWAFFENNNTYPDLTHWKKVITQEYEDDKMDAAVAADATIPSAPPDDLHLPSAPPADLPIPSAPPANLFCIPMGPPNEMCSGKTNQNLNYTTYCPKLSNCNLKNKCVTDPSHCMLTQQQAMAENSQKLGQDKNNMRSVQGSMKINNQAKK